jgi:hypothetical protein
MNFEDLEERLDQEVLDNPDLIDEDSYPQYEMIYIRPDGTGIVLDFDKVDHKAKAIYLK